MGMAKAASQRRHLVALPPTAEVIPMDNIRRQGGYATIWRVRLEEVLEFKLWWEFATKQSNQIDKRNDLAKMEHQNESMALTILHDGVIRFAAIHAERYEGYAFWWNGGILRDMFTLDNRYGDNIATWVAYENTSGDELLHAEHLHWFRKKRTELAWALLHIMDEVHKSHNLHNDISPDNILLHFLEEESKVYIGVCDWGLATKSTEPMKSLYTFRDKKSKDENMEGRWWVEPAIVYIHNPHADVQVIPLFSRASEEYAVAKIAARIFGSHMSEDYYNWQKDSEGYSISDLQRIF
jgi:serine/threonine protein kinase